MAEPTYDIFFKGEALDGFAMDVVRSNFCKLFKTTDEKAAGFFSGKVVALKRNIDKPTAIKFQSTLKKAGFKIYIKASAQAAEQPKPSPAPAATPVATHVPEGKPAAPQAAPAPEQKPAASTPEPQNAQAAASVATVIELAPVGTDVLSEAERDHQAPVEVDTSGISLESQFATHEPMDTPAPVEVNTSHLSTAEAGADLLEGHHAPAPPPAPDVSHLDLDESGEPLNIDNIDIPLPEPDTSHMTLAEPGAQIDTSDKDTPPPPPSTDHIQLD